MGQRVAEGLRLGLRGPGPWPRRRLLVHLALGAVRRRPGHDPAVVAELNATIARQQQFAKDGDFEKFMAADNEFHAKLYGATDKQDIWSLVRSRSGHIDRLRRMHLPSPGKAQDIVRHHRLIAKAIGAGEPDAAQNHLRTHLSGTLSDLTQIRARYPEYLSD